MLYRTLGRTGYRVSQLGFGAMRLPMVGEGADARVDRELAVPMMHRAFEAGVNYIDSAVGYCNRDSQCAVGDAVKSWGREKIVISTKNPYYEQDEKAWWQNLEDSLERLQVEYIDIYNHHGLGWELYQQQVEHRLGKLMLKAKDQGLIKHICCSFHDSNEALRNLVDSGYVDVVTLQYNMLYRDLEDGIAHAHAKGVGIVAMGPVGGGRLGATSDVLANLVPGINRVPELALRFVLANPNVTVALSGMSTMQQVEENVVTASDPISLTDEHKAAIEEHLQRMKSMAQLYCSGCNYCQPCPQDVSIASIFATYNTGRVYGLWDIARSQYARIGANPNRGGAKADACIECGECEPKCPQQLSIREQLKEAHAALTAEEAVGSK
jgi:predicted aldo/keto reductase-like oxidoreductase